MKWYEIYNVGLSWLKNDEVVEKRNSALNPYERMVRDGYKPTSF
jgi:hypothetical protein